MGEKVGPDLAGIGARYSRAELLASMLRPSERIAEGYAGSTVITKDDQAVFGRVLRDDARGVELVDTNGTHLEFPRAEIDVVNPSNLSVMPEGLCSNMSLEEFTDLLDWLVSLR